MAWLELECVRECSYNALDKPFASASVSSCLLPSLPNTHSPCRQSRRLALALGLSRHLGRSM